MPTNASAVDQTPNPSVPSARARIAMPATPIARFTARPPSWMHRRAGDATARRCGTVASQPAAHPRRVQ